MTIHGDSIHGSARLDDNRLVLLYPVETTRESFIDGHERFDACARGADEALRLYLTPSAHARLHDARESMAPLADVTVEGLGDHAPFGVTFERVERARIEPELALLALVIKIEGEPSLGTFLDFADLARLRGPLYPGQSRPHFRLLGESVGVPLEELLARWAPAGEPVFPDQRLFSLSYAASQNGLPRESVYAVCATDSASMPSPPEEDIDRFFRDNAYRRWDNAGTVYGFTHYGGGIVHLGGSPEWLAGLVGNHYLDVASWVATVAARRLQLARRVDGQEFYRELGAVWAHRMDYERERLSEQDQGRQLARLWLDVIERDRGDLRHIVRFEDHLLGKG